MHSLKVLFSSTTNRKFLRVTASAAKPVLVEFKTRGVTAFNAGTLNQFRLGSTSAGAEHLALTNTPAAGALATVGNVLLTADTDIWVGLGLTGTAATTGEMWIIAELSELNVADVNANAIP